LANDMNATFVGILRGNQIEWTGQGPPESQNREKGQAVCVTLLEPEDAFNSRGQRMAAALEQLAQKGGCQSIPDPSAWERLERRDRQLPGRDSDVD